MERHPIRIPSPAQGSLMGGAGYVLVLILIAWWAYGVGAAAMVLVASIITGISVSYSAYRAER
jgi:hypothetical protein